MFSVCKSGARTFIYIYNRFLGGGLAGMWCCDPHRFEGFTELLLFSLFNITRQYFATETFELRFGVNASNS